MTPLSYLEPIIFFLAMALVLTLPMDGCLMPEPVPVQITAISVDGKAIDLTKTTDIITGINVRPKLTISFSEELFISTANSQNVSLSKLNFKEIVPLSYSISPDGKTLTVSLNPTAPDLDKDTIYQVLVKKDIISVSGVKMEKVCRLR